jgi:hypothetical protein
MIRRPSTFTQLYDWHRRAVRGEDVPRHDGVAHCGWYRMRAVKGGPWIPVRVFVERDIDPVTGELTNPEILRMEIAGKLGGDPHARATYLTPITKYEYERLMEAHRSSLRMQATHAAYDLTAAPVRP